MRLSSRARQLQHAELANVHRALAEALTAIKQAQEAQEAHFADVPGRDMFGDKKDKEAAAPPAAANWNIKELRYAWTPVKEALDAWLSHGDEVFLPALMAWDDDQDESRLAAVRKALEERQALAAGFFERLPALRAQTTFIAPVRGPVANLIGAVEVVQRVDDVELVPSILSGQTETSSSATGDRADRYRTADDVARSLREARPPRMVNLAEEEKEKAKKAPGLFGRLTSFLKRD